MLSNGALLDAAEEAGFEVLLTTDRRIRDQQNLRARRVALVVLTGSTRWSRVREHTERIAAAIAAATSGSYAEIDVPFEQRPDRV
jgi:DNA-binding transcriptional regulator LsrR (DeoR family)